MALIKVGEGVTWQVDRHYPQKTGKVIAVVPRGQSAFDALAKATTGTIIPSRREFQDVNLRSDRYLVEVTAQGHPPRVKPLKTTRFVAPPVDSLERDASKAAG